MTMKPIEEAPFWKYLEILRENGHEEDADISEQLYVDLLTTVKGTDGKFYTKEQVMNATFNKVLRAAEIIVEHAQKELEQIPVTNNPISGKVLGGLGTEELSPDSLRTLMTRQSFYHEENKLQQQQVVR